MNTIKKKKGGGVLTGDNLAACVASHAASSAKDGGALHNAFRHSTKLRERVCT